MLSLLLLLLLLLLLQQRFCSDPDTITTAILLLPLLLMVLLSLLLLLLLLLLLTLQQRFCLWEWLQDPSYSPPSPGRVIVSATATTEDAAVITSAAHLPLAEECLTLLCVLVSEMPALPGPAGAAQALRREVVHR
jgi:hypothetical protein